MEDFLYINILLALSNFTVLPVLILQFYKGYYIAFLLSLYNAFFSGLYHIFENRYGLYGVQKVIGLNRYLGSEIYLPILLNLDRFFTSLLILYHFLFFKFYMISFLYINALEITLLLSFTLTSELFGRYQYVNVYLITHLLSHIYGYYFLFYIYVYIV